MTADLTASAERALAANARPRDELIAALGGKPTKPWVVVRQHHIGGEVVDTVECEHRSEWAAEWCARRQTKRGASKHGAY
jgi:hypothetical protein